MRAWCCVCRPERLVATSRKVEREALRARVEFLRELMQEVGQRFIAAFHRALPDVPRAELLWRLHFSIGVIAHNLAGRYHLQMLSGGLCDPTDVNANIERVVAFLAAGLRAPSAAKG